MKIVIFISGISAHTRLPSPRRRPNFLEVSDQQMSASILRSRRGAAAPPAHALHAAKTHGKVESGKLDLNIKICLVVSVFKKQYLIYQIGILTKIKIYFGNYFNDV